MKVLIHVDDTMTLPPGFIDGDFQFIAENVVIAHVEEEEEGGEQAISMTAEIIGFLAPGTMINGKEVQRLHTIIGRLTSAIDELKSRAKN
jgi:hypothetical protein